MEKFYVPHTIIFPYYDVEVLHPHTIIFPYYIGEILPTPASIFPGDNSAVLVR